MQPQHNVTNSMHNRIVSIDRAMQAAAICCLLVLLAAGAAGGSSKERCHSDEKAALVAISAALGDPYDLSSWTPDTSCCDDWAGVDCDPSTGRVVGLSIFQDDNLTGTIPDAIASLAHLRNLMLHHLPGLSGPIPPAIARLSSLSLIMISWTGVSGPVPSALGALTSLSYLNLGFNSLSGAIPPSLAALPNLVFLDLSRNRRLTGPLPPLLFSRLRRDDPNQRPYLLLSHNNLSGSIPAEFDALHFDRVDLSRNGFAGDASALFGRAKKVRQLDLSRNAFSFNLSGAGYELPEKLASLDVSHNAIYGGIPAQVASLVYFNASYNRLCGQVPATARFDAYSYQHNKCLCGPPLTNPCN